MNKFFKLDEHNTNIKTEITAGLTTYITMAYIIFVNPLILSNSGMDKGAVFVATILASAIATLIMGLYANVPYAQAPGMGMNAFFTFTVCISLKFTWNQALAIVFICGLINILITITRIRKAIIKSIPHSLQYAIGAGIGLFITYIGIKNAHFLNFTSEGYNVVTTFPDKGVLAKDVIPSLVNFTDPVSQLALIGLIITSILMLYKIKGALLFGIIITTLIGIPMGITKVPSFENISFAIPSLKPTLFQLDILGLFSDKSKLFLVLTTIFAFSISDTFDTIGTFLGTGKKSKIFDEEDEKALERKGFSSKLDKALFSDAIATSIGALLGTSNTTTYIESSAGISEGGRTGLTSVTVALLFLCSLILSPLISIIPQSATAPVLIIIGILMMDSILKIKWDTFEEALPCFFTFIMMSFSYSIANGVAAGFIFYIISKIFKGKIKEIHPLLFIVTFIFIINFVFIAINKE